MKLFWMRPPQLKLSLVTYDERDRGKGSVSSRANGVITVHISRKEVEKGWAVRS